MRKVTVELPRQSHLYEEISDGNEWGIPILRSFLPLLELW